MKKSNKKHKKKHKIALFDKFLSCFAIYKNELPDYNRYQLHGSEAGSVKNKMKKMINLNER